MIQRKKKKKEKMRGNRFHGKGDTKNKRGGGCRGGRGRAGSHKGKFNKYFGEFGVKKTLGPRKRYNAMNLDDLNLIIDKMVAEKKAETENGMVVIDGKKIDCKKILSRGKLSHKAVLKNLMVSKKAVKKILASGSKIEGNVPAGKEGEEIEDEDDEFELVEGEAEEEK